MREREGCLELPERLRLDLADTFARDRELLADFFERVIRVHADAEAHPEHAFLARRERGQNARRRFAQVRLDRRVDGQDRVLVLDEVAEVAVFLVADGRFEGDRLLRDLQNLADLFERHAELLGELLRRRFAADLVEHLARGTHQLVDRLDHVDRDADGARLVGDRTRDRLPDPPCRIGRELVAAAVLELVDRLHQADIAFLDEIEELQPAVRVFLRDGDHEAEVRLDHLLLRDPRFAFALLHGGDDAAVFLDVETGFGGKRLDLVAKVLHLVALVLGEAHPALALEAADAANPVRIEFVAEILLQEFVARHTVALCETQKAAFETHEALVDRVELLDERLDTVVVEERLFTSSMRSEVSFWYFFSCAAASSSPFSASSTFWSCSLRSFL